MKFIKVIWRPSTYLPSVQWINLKQLTTSCLRRRDVYFTYTSNCSTVTCETYDPHAPIPFSIIIHIPDSVQMKKKNGTCPCINQNILNVWTIESLTIIDTNWSWKCCNKIHTEIVLGHCVVNAICTHPIVCRTSERYDTSFILTWYF